MSNQLPVMADAEFAVMELLWVNDVLTQDDTMSRTETRRCQK